MASFRATAADGGGISDESITVVETTAPLAGTHCLRPQRERATLLRHGSSAGSESGIVNPLAGKRGGNAIDAQLPRPG